MILAIRTDKPTAELYLLKDTELIDRFAWHADRELANTLLENIQVFIVKNHLMLNQLSGIIVFTGEGSFTGLRIGATVANALAYSLGVPIVSSEGRNWLTSALPKLAKTKLGDYVVPQYDSEPNITQPAYRTGGPKNPSA